MDSHVSNSRPGGRVDVLDRQAQLAERYVGDRRSIAAIRELYGGHELEPGNYQQRCYRVVGRIFATKQVSGSHCWDMCDRTGIMRLYVADGALAAHGSAGDVEVGDSVSVEGSICVTEIGHIVLMVLAFARLRG